jgi:ABC-type multidrug transport system fused ATPase/permease subunit
LTRSTPAPDPDAPSPSSSRRGLLDRLPPNLARFLGYVLRYKPLLAIALFAGLAKFGLQFAFPTITGLMVDNVIIDNDGFGGTANSLTAEDREWWLVALAIAAVSILAVYCVVTFFRDYLTGQLGFRVIRDLRQDLFGHLHRLSLHFYSKERTGSIVSRVITDISQAANLVNGGVVAVVMDLGAMVIGLGFLLWISPTLTLVALVILPAYSLSLKFLRPRVRHAGKLVQRSIGRISGSVQEQLAGIALVQTSAAEGRESARFRADTEEHYDRVVHQKALSAVTATLGEGLTKLGTVAVVVVGGYLALKYESISAGELVAFVGYLGIMYFPVQRFGEVNVVYATCMASLERIFRVFEITPKIAERPDAHPHPPELGEVEFEAVRFSYADDSDESRVRLHAEDDRGTTDPETGQSVEPDPRDRRDPTTLSAAERRRSVRRELRRQMRLERRRKELERAGRLPVEPPVERRWVIDGLSFTVPAGQRVALVGPSGSGKTTLVSLLPRLYDVSDGAIRIDGRDLRDYKKQPLREAIGIVQQDSFLFSGSVKDNLLYGRPGASFGQIVEAATAANADGFIRELPEGYETPLGERGVNLSGGQRQRLSIARAILKDPKILILDEATSALDVESERLVQEALERLMEGRTSFIIAHRLSTVRNADRILVIDRGRAVEDGTHDSLVARGGLYAKLARQAFAAPHGGLEAA